MKTLIIAVLVAILGAGVYMYFQNTNVDKGGQSEVNNKQDDAASTTTDVGTSTDTANVEDKTTTILGKSAGGQDIVAYHAGTGSKEVLFIGGIHGGYEWNTVLTAYELLDYMRREPSAIPADVMVTVIPVFNPDGLSKVVGTTSRFTSVDVSKTPSVQVSGRVNANNVDLNRNFDCDWKAKGVWQNKEVSGGTAVFSEPESQAIKAYIEKKTPSAVVVWFSAAGGVYASSCGGGVATETNALTKTYANAAGYTAHENFDSYAITGDITNWLAKKGVPAISVLLTTHQDPEWEKNKAGVKAVLNYFAE